MKNMVIAFILNLVFAIFEFVGGLYTNSVSLMSDAIHDIGDALSIGSACLFEKRSKKPADNKFTFGYSRYSVLSALRTSTILFTGSAIILVNAIIRLFNPQPINYNGLLIFAIIGLVVNSAAVFFTRRGDSLNEKSINLHMLEDVLGWAIVLVGAIIMKFTEFALLDVLLSIGTSLFILIHSIKNIWSSTSILMERVPQNINIRKIKRKILSTDGVKEVHHFRIWSLDEHNTYAIMHIVAEKDFSGKDKIRKMLHENGITNTTIEIETTENRCNEVEKVEACSEHHHHGHLHHHHHH